MTLQPRRTRHSDLTVDSHLHQHDDDLDALDRSIGGVHAKLDRLLWAFVTATVMSATAIMVWAVQVVSEP